jgi:hypothetical protein
MISQYFPDLDFSREITTAYCRQLLPDFSMNSRPIHIDSAKVGCGEVQVIWAEYDREWSSYGSGFKSGARYEVRVVIKM